MKPILYITFDSVQEGVGASQVLAYVKRISETRRIELVSLEKETPDKSLINEIEACGIVWNPLPFGTFGPIGGVNRIFRIWKVIDRRKIIHARGNFSGIAAMLRFPKFWIWDSRSLHADQRRAISGGRGLISFCIMRLAEQLMGNRASAIIAITYAVVPIYVSRYKINAKKIHVISTCVDTKLFGEKPLKKSNVIRILLQGTFSNAYDIALMNKIIAKFRTMGQVEVTVCTSIGTTELWKELDYDEVRSARYQDMPEIIASHDFGMSIWREELGICLKSVASTKVAEFLSVGRPIFVNHSQGDMDSIITKNRIGVVTRGRTDSEVKIYVSKMVEILEGNELAKRCANVANQMYNLDDAIQKLNEIYSMG
jgi:glycosyltransferase involved in cell wall biosynthesis